MNQQSSGNKIQEFFGLIYKAILGKQEDYTSLPLNRAIILLSVPMILEMAMESSFALVDVYFVSRLGKEAVATVGLTESVITIVYSIAIGLSMAATAMIARRTGEKNHGMAAKAAAQAIWIGVVSSALLGIPGLIFAPEILGLMGADQAVLDTGTGYTRWMFGSNGVIMLIFINNGSFRGAGDAAIAFRVLVISNLLNMILDPLFIFGIGSFEGFGLEGAAYATNIGRGIGVLSQLIFMFRGEGVLKIKLPDFSLDLDIIVRLFKVSLGGTGQFLIASCSWIFLMKIMSEFGSDALAGYTISIRILIFTILPAWGMANAAATLVGQHLGAQNPDLAEKSVWKTALYATFFLVFVAIIYFVTAEPVVGFFTDEAAVAQVGIDSLRWFCLGYLFFAYGMVISQAFNGAGDTKTPTILNFIFFWLVQIPLAFFLSLTLEWGPKGTFIAVVIAEALLAGACILVFRQGKWKDSEI